MSNRIDKVNKQIQRDLMEILQQEVDDPSLELLSITRVETSADLHESRVYFSLLDDKKVDHAKSTLDKMNKFIRFHLGKRITMKFLPELKFIYDDSMKYSVYIYDKIEQVRSEDVTKSPKNDEEDNRSDKKE